MSIWQTKTTIRPNDRKFSQYIKLRDKGICQYRFKCYGDPGTDNSHFKKRRHETVRYDPENCDLACRKCHHFVENDPQGQKTLEEWKKKQLGEQRYKALIIRANATGKRDDRLTAIYVNQLLKDVLRNKDTV